MDALRIKADRHSRCQKAHQRAPRTRPSRVLCATLHQRWREQAAQRPDTCATPGDDEARSAFAFPQARQSRSAAPGGYRRRGVQTRSRGRRTTLARDRCALRCSSAPARSSRALRPLRSLASEPAARSARVPSTSTLPGPPSAMACTYQARDAAASSPRAGDGGRLKERRSCPTCPPSPAGTENPMVAAALAEARPTTLPSDARQSRRSKELGRILEQDYGCRGGRRRVARTSIHHRRSATPATSRPSLISRQRSSPTASRPGLICAPQRSLGWRRHVPEGAPGCDQGASP